MAEWIGHKKPSEMIMNVDEDEKIKIFIYPSDSIAGVLQKNTDYWFLTENGLYEVLMQSRKAIAKEFKRQVKIILKEIRMTGKYEVNLQIKVPTTMKELLLIALEQEEKIEKLQIENKEKDKKIEHADFSKEYLKSEGVMDINALSKNLQKMEIPMGRNQLFEYLRKEGYIVKSGNFNIPSQKSIELGIMVNEEYTFRNKYGVIRNARLAKITPKGTAYFYKKLFLLEIDFKSLFHSA